MHARTETRTSGSSSCPEQSTGRMQRQDKRITDTAALEAILDRATCCTVVLCDGDRPYAVRMNFAYDSGTLYLPQPSRV
jgi:hypothetical protein